MLLRLEGEGFKLGVQAIRSKVGNHPNPALGEERLFVFKDTPDIRKLFKGQSFVPGARAHVEKVADYIKQSDRSTPQTALEWNEFLSIFPNTDDVDEYLRDNSLHIPLLEELFHSNPPDHEVLEPLERSYDDDGSGLRQYRSVGHVRHSGQHTVVDGGATRVPVDGLPNQLVAKQTTRKRNVNAVKQNLHATNGEEREESDYELLRRNNIERNLEFLESIGLGSNNKPPENSPPRKKRKESIRSTVPRERHERVAKAEAVQRSTTQLQTEEEFTSSDTSRRERERRQAKFYYNCVFEKCDETREMLKGRYCGKGFYDEDVGVEETRYISDVVWFDPENDDQDGQYVVLTHTFKISSREEDEAMYSIDKELDRMIDFYRKMRSF